MMNNFIFLQKMKFLPKLRNFRSISLTTKRIPNTIFQTNCSKSPFAFFHTSTLTSEDKISMNFINRKGEKTVVKAAPYDTILDVVIDNDLDIESFGVCEGTLGCSTCHVILENNIFKSLEESCPTSAEEFDMLDLACGLTETSRLGCQVEITKDMEGCTIKVPKEAIDARDL